jgi:hypothetical protein
MCAEHRAPHGTCVYKLSPFGTFFLHQHSLQLQVNSLMERKPQTAHTATPIASRQSSARDSSCDISDDRGHHSDGQINPIPRTRVALSNIRGIGSTGLRPTGDLDEPSVMVSDDGNTSINSDVATGGTSGGHPSISGNTASTAPSTQQSTNFGSRSSMAGSTQRNSRNDGRSV